MVRDKKINDGHLYIIPDVIIGLEDDVCLNGISGYVDFITVDRIVLIDNMNVSHIIKVDDVKSAKVNHVFIKNCISCITLRLNK